MRTTNTDVLVQADELQMLVTARLREAGLQQAHAERVAEVLVHADLRGVRSHGVMRTEHYVKRIHAGSLNTHPQFTFRRIRSGTGLFNADGGMGHVACDLAMGHAIELARESGIAMVGVEDGSHCGALSFFVSRAARERMIGIALTHTDKCVAPFGGARPFFGTNPMAFGFPCAKHPPVIFDMATSNTAYGKILHAREQGGTIPDDWGLDEQGAPTTDPDRVQALTPFGGAKGYGIGMAIDVLTGVLIGAQFGPHITAMYGDYEKRRGLASLMIAIDPATFIPAAQFSAQMDAMVDELHDQPAGPGFDRVLAPGDPEIAREAENQKHGVPVLASIYAYLRGQG